MENYNPRNNNNNNRNYNNNNNNNRNFNNNNNYNGGDRGGNGNFRNNNNNNGNNNGNFRNNNGNNYNKGGGNFNNSNSYGGGEVQIKTYPSELPIATNYFRFAHLNPQRNCYYKYSVEIENLPEDSKKMRNCIYRCARAQIGEKLGKTIFNNTLLYSKTLVADAAELQFTSKFRETEYKIALKFTNAVQNESFEALALYKRYFNTLISQIDFIDMKGSYFDARNACIMNDYNLDIWSGFAPTVSQLKKGILLNLNVTHKVIRYETALDLIFQLQSNYSNKNDFVREVQASFQNLSVITRYNGETNFTIDSICMDKSPRDIFEVKVKKGSGALQKKENRKRLQADNIENHLNSENKQKTASGSKPQLEFDIRTYSYVDYYWEKYGKKINPDQPLLKVINKRKNNQEIYLVPELCYLTGLTESMRSNFNMMKDMNAKTKGNPALKLKETQDLIQKILSTPGGKKAIEDWEITLEPDVLRLKGVKINTGNVLMAQQKDGSNQRLKIDIDKTPDLDRKIQNEMYSQPHLNNWVIAYQAREKNAFENFQSTLTQVMKTFNYTSNPPTVVEVSSPRFEDWRELLKTKVTPQTQMVCCLIQGNKGNGQLYKPLKNFFLTERPIPSQIMLSGTINKPKGLRSVVNKILIQICAKIGGEPWALEDLPFTKEPTMVCAVECFDKKNLRAPLMAMCATFNSMFTKYSSFVKEAKDGNDSASLLGFKENNKIFPKHIILFKEGLCQSRFAQVIESDVQMIDRAISELDPNLKIPVTYLTLNKKTSVKLFYEESNDLSNCPPGTVIQDEITCENQKDFYLISQKTTQGVAQPTHYYIAYDNKGVDQKDVHTLVYRLCYLYYNWTGAVRIPAPCQNVKKLMRLITEKCSDRNNTVIPAERLYKQLKCLYYL